MRSTYIISFSLIFLTTFTAFGQDNGRKIDAYLQEQHLAGKFNGNALILENGKRLLFKSYGYADAAKTEPLTPKHRFHIGSIAKEFDAVGVMMLAEQGKLKLTDPLSKYIPELPAWSKSITIKNLLQYTSGLPDVNWKTIKNDSDNWRDLMAATQLKFAPGTQYDYNNNNTFMRRKLIEKISGISFKDFVQRRLLERAGIQNGVIDPDDNTPLLAKPFDNNFKVYPLAPPITGWTCLDLDDFLKWSDALNAFKLINARSTLQISEPFNNEAQTGLGSNMMKNGKIVNHTHGGVAIRYQAIMQYQAKTSRTIILMTNQRQDNINDLAGAINQMLDDH
jgi:D-alanyl-D-alanine carboxypeptidase